MTCDYVTALLQPPRSTSTVPLLSPMLRSLIIDRPQRPRKSSTRVRGSLSVRARGTIAGSQSLPVGAGSLLDGLVVIAAEVGAAKLAKDRSLLV